ncbi:hypothetical protein SAMN05216436_10313 [bacterium A37T11]|nr:hypothetical protein SAMN05216436_10313 [bacterium A37T11]
MRAVLGFCLFFCFLLLRGYAVYAEVHQDDTNYAYTSAIKKISHKKHGAIFRSSQLIKRSGLDADDSSYVENDDEDVELNNGHTSVAKYHFNFFGTPEVNTFYCYFYNNLELPGRRAPYILSDKYILQRVLRL